MGGISYVSSFLSFPSLIPFSVSTDENQRLCSSSHLMKDDIQWTPSSSR